MDAILSMRHFAQPTSPSLLFIASIICTAGRTKIFIIQSLEGSTKMRVLMIEWGLRGAARRGVPTQLASDETGHHFFG